MIEQELLEKVKKNPWYLKQIPEELQTEEICLEAIKRNPDALDFVKQEYLTKEMLLIAIANFEKCIYKKDIIECFNNMQKRFAKEYQLFVLRWCL